MANRRPVGNLLALALLALLSAGRPMHPYEMATLLRRTNKDHDMKIKWGSLYTVVRNLEKHGLIAATSSDRDGRRPERTVYAITADGRDELRDWLRELVGKPQKEYPRFEAALSVLGVLPPDEVVALLHTRVRALSDSIAAQRDALARSAPVPRIFLVESEYALAMTEAEVTWIRSLLAEIDAGTLSGVDQWRAYHKTGRPDPEFMRLLDEGGPPPE